MIDFGGILDDLFVGLSYELLKAGMKELIKRAPEIIRDATRYFGNKRINKLKKITLSEGSGIALTKNEIKVIESLENRGILLKGTTKKITSQEEGFLNFVRPLIDS